MSLQELMVDSRKQWLTGRMEGLKVDAGISIPTAPSMTGEKQWYNLNYVESLNTVIGFTCSLTGAAPQIINVNFTRVGDLVTFSIPFMELLATAAAPGLILAAAGSIPARFRPLNNEVKNVIVLDTSPALSTTTSFFGSIYIKSDGSITISKGATNADVFSADGVAPLNFGLTVGASDGGGFSTTYKCVASTA